MNRSLYLCAWITVPLMVVACGSSSKTDGAPSDGSPESGLMSDGAVGDGAVGDGAVSDGAAGDGAVGDSAVGDGAVADGGQTASSTLAIGPNGGTVTSADGRFKLTVPPRALNAVVTIAITTVTPTPAGAVGPAYATSPAMTTFLIPAVATFKPQATDFTGLTLTELRVTALRMGGSWTELDQQIADVGAGTVRGQTLQLSSFSLTAGLCRGCDAPCDPAKCFFGATVGVPGSGVAGRCAAFGNGCSRCVPACDTDGDGFCPGNPSNDQPGGDCDDSNPNVNPNAPEICGNGKDDNCNNHQDEGCKACTADADCPSGLEGCVSGVCQVCSSNCDSTNCMFGVMDNVPGSGVVGHCLAFGHGCLKCVPSCDADGDGYCPGAAANGQQGGDCNDADPTVSPGAVEICGNQVDDNCDGQVDEGCVICKVDKDCAAGQICVNSLCQSCPAACDPASCRIGATDGVPNSGTAGKCVTEGNACSVCVPTCDGDGDGFCPGNPPAGVPGGDCDDTNSAANPNAHEICGNGKDDNCNGHIDEGCKACGQDSDCSAGFEACISGVCSICSGDCDPTTNCRFGVMDNVPNSGVAGRCAHFGNGCLVCVPSCDADGDGYCPGTPGSNQPGGDCDDTNPKIHPGALEVCGNSVDDDCNGVVDDSCVSCRQTSATCGTQQSCGSPAM